MKQAINRSLTAPNRSLLSFSLLGALLFASSAFCALLLSSTSHASSLSDWNAGLIMDDSVMADKATMNTSAIQNFLNSKVPTCDTNGAQASEMNNSGVPDYNHDGTIQRWEWGKYKYNQTTFPCLKDYVQGGKTAAQIIYSAAQTYSINPQVLITLLQKEQGLVTDTWPLNIQYRSATGYGCPDGAACDSAYYGLTNQVKWAATMFRSILNKSPTWYSPYVVGNNYVQYNPSASCGGTTVNIRNLATAALYDYTPYQPNAAALSAGYGTGNSCSSYGNRNFYLYFTDWFGSTLGTPFFTYGGKIYIDGDNDTYYYITTPAILRTFGYGTVFKKMRTVNAAYMSSHTSSGNLPLLVRFGSSDPNVYAVADGKTAVFPDRTIFETTYGFSFGQEASLPAGWIYRYASLGQMNSIMRLSDGPSIYSVESGKKRQFGSAVAYNTLGSPVYSTRPSTLLNSLFASTVADGAPIITDGSIAQATDTGNQYVWRNGSLYPLTADQKTNWLAGIDYLAPSATLTQLPVSSTIQKSYITSGDGTYYIVGQGRRFPISSSVMATHSLTTSDFQTVPSVLVNRFALTQLASLDFVRANGGSSISRLQGTASYSVLSRDDFLGLGGSFASVVSIPSEIASFYTASGSIFPDGRLVQISGDPRIYIVDSQLNKYYIPSPELASQYGIRLTGIEQVASGALSGHTDKGGLTRLIKAADGSYWLIDSGHRLHVAYDWVTTMLGYTDTSTFALLSNQLLARIPNGGLFSQYLRDSATGKVYLIENGKKHLYASRAAFERHAKWSDVKNVSHDFLLTIADGPAITS